MINKSYECEFEEHVNKQKLAVSLQNTIGKLLYTKGIELVFFRNNLVDTKASEILSLHDYSIKIDKSVDISLTAELAELLLGEGIINAKLDIARLAIEWTQEHSEYTSKQDFLRSKLKKMTQPDESQSKPGDVVLYGFGRIGRLVARELIIQSGKGQHLRLRAIVTRNIDDETLKKRAALLKNDSVHGAFSVAVTVDYENKICGLGNLVGFLLLIWFLFRWKLSDNVRLIWNKRIIYLVGIVSLLMNLNAFIYFIPILVF